MMAITHILLGGLLGSVFGPSYVFAGFLGGLMPDLDILIGEHRVTTHYPFYFGIAAISAAVSFVMIQHWLWLQITVFFAAASVHCLTDMLGGGLEYRPWEETDDSGVYSHFHDKWLETRHMVYDGSPGDLAISLVAGGLLIYQEVYTRPVAGLMAVAVLYTLVRKKVPDHVPENAEDKAIEWIREKISGLF